MSDMKCTKCNSDLEQIGDFFTYTNPHCTLCGDKNIWQELITTRKALDVAVDALKSAKTRMELINNSKFANLNHVLQIQCQCEVLKIDKALEQIKDKE